jgi:hypothetical protein
MASKMVGMANTRSAARMTNSSTQPPRYAANAPNVPPIRKARLTSRKASGIETRAPHITRLSTSRPISSVPNGCAAEGG